MANPTITNSDIAEIAMFNNIYRDRDVTVAAGEVLAKNTVLGVVSSGAASAGYQLTTNMAPNLAALIAVDAGEFTLAVDGGAGANITGIDLTSATSLEEVVALLDAAVSASGVTVTLVNGSQIKFTSDTTGADSAVALTQYVGAGDDLSTAALLAFADLTTVAGADANANLGKTVACVSTGANGEDYPRFILAQEIDNSAGVSALTSSVRVMVSGEIDGSLAVFDNGTDTMDTTISSGVTMRDAFKTEGILDTSLTVEDELDNQ